MSEYIEQRLLVGNCLDTLKRLADNSIDSIVTDPPYGLEFMGKEWDAPWKKSEVVEVTDKSTNGIFHDKGFSHGIRFSRGLFEMQEFQKWCESWAKEVYRVLKPGGHILCFSGSRTYHRMASGIEDAGFEIRDSIHWTYGSGFPKSLDISKAIDKAAKAERKVVGTQRTNVGMQGGNFTAGSKTADVPITAPATEAAKQWQGWGTALKPSHEPIVLARKPLIGTVAENVLQYKTGGINIDATRIGYESTPNPATNPLYRAENGYKVPTGGEESEGAVTWTSSKNPVTPTGRFPANTLLTHNHDCQVIQEGYISDTKTPDEVSGGIWEKGTGDGKPAGNTYTDVPAVYTCTPNCPVTMFPNTTTGGGNKNSKTSKAFFGNMESNSDYDSNYSIDSGSAARFFHNSQWQPADDITPFIYQAKASKKERNAGLDNLEKKPGGSNAKGYTEDVAKGNDRNKPTANFHPTVKPIELMRYLIKLITPPKGTVLDPFLGSGTTAVAAILDGFEWKGCEMTEDYLPIIKGRVAWARKEVKEKAKQEQLEL